MIARFTARALVLKAWDARALAEFGFGLDPTAPDAHLFPRITRVGETLTASFTQPAGVGGIHTFTLATTGKSRIFLRLKVTAP